MLAIEEIHQKEQLPFELLLLADPSQNKVLEYVNEGRCYIAKYQQTTIGVMVLCELKGGVLEIKNIAIKELFQRKGFGRQLLRWAFKFAYEKGFERLRIGTGNSSIGQFLLYQKEGFEPVYIVKDFFLENYEEPIFENGIQCKHLLVLEKEIRCSLL